MATALNNADTRNIGQAVSYLSALHTAARHGALEAHLQDSLQVKTDDFEKQRNAWVAALTTVFQTKTKEFQKNKDATPRRVVRCLYFSYLSTRKNYCFVGKF